MLQMEASGIKVASVNGTTPYSERDALMEDLRCGHPRTRLLYVTPELCLNESFRAHLRTVYDQGKSGTVVQ